MTRQEYDECIDHIVIEGYGYAALTDISERLRTYHENIMAVMHEMKAEMKTIKKICKGTAGNKEKVQTVLSMMEE